MDVGTGEFAVRDFFITRSTARSFSRSSPTSLILETVASPYSVKFSVCTSFHLSPFGGRSTGPSAARAAVVSATAQKEAIRMFGFSDSSLTETGDWDPRASFGLPPASGRRSLLPGVFLRWSGPAQDEVARRPDLVHPL